MRRHFNLLLIGFLLLLCFYSCSNDMYENESTESELIVKPFKMSKVNMTSRGVSLPNYISDYIKVCDGIGNIPEKFRGIIPSTTDRGEMVSSEEYAVVMKYLQEHPNEGTKELNSEIYFIQYVGGGKHRYYAGEDFNHAKHYVDNATNHMNLVEILDESGRWFHFRDYNANDGKRTLVIGHKILSARFHESYGDKNKQEQGDWKFYNIDGQYYLCFDYGMEKNSGEKVIPDGIYDDYVIKMIPCDIDDGTVQDTDDNTAVKQDTINGSVEVNFNLQEHNDWQESKLSVHVRANTDFIIEIPIEREYYCAVDDMFIVQRHIEGEYTYSNKESEVVSEFNIDGEMYSVKLLIAYEDRQIVVSSIGINKSIINYLNKTYNDGITFEVHNYYPFSVNRETMLSKMNCSTIHINDNVDYICTRKDEVNDAEVKRIK